MAQELTHGETIEPASRLAGEAASGAHRREEGTPAGKAGSDGTGVAKLLLEAPVAIRRRLSPVRAGAWAVGCLRLDARGLTFRNWSSRQVERRALGELVDVGIEEAGIAVGSWNMALLRIGVDGFLCGRRRDVDLWVRVIESLRAGTPVARLLEHTGEARGATEIVEAVELATAEHEALLADRANRGPLWRGEMPEEMRRIELCGYERTL